MAMKTFTERVYLLYPAILLSVIVILLFVPLQVTSSQPASSVQQPENAIAAALPWRGCGINDSQDKVIATFPIRNGGLNGKTARMKCGSEKPPFGFRHIRQKHPEWKENAALVRKQWFEVVDDVVGIVAMAPTYTNFSFSRGTFCYTRPYYLVYRGQVVRTIHPGLVMNASGDIITVFPGGRCASNK